ncbi:DedA family protein [Patescibacteria group bacterium]
MFENSSHFLNFIFEFLGKYGLWAVFAFMFAESSLIPIPSEATMALSGFLSGLGYFNIWSGILVGSLASIMGTMFIYTISYKKGEPWVKKIIKKYGKYIFLHEGDYEKSKEWFSKRSQWLVFIARLTPVIRMFISLPAGVTKMNTTLYLVLVTIAAFIWSSVFSFVGYKLGENWIIIEPFFKKFQILIIVVFILGLIWYLKKHLSSKNKKEL